jgi:MFS family permease
MKSVETHNWSRILAVFATGVAAAFLVGKAPAALPALRADLQLTLLEAGLVVSVFSLIAAIAGVFFGSLSDSAGQRRVALIGILIAVAAGLAGALANSPALLIASRIAEGIGFFMISVSLPGLIIRLSDARRRQTAMGLWGAYLPLGAGLILFAAGFTIAAIGWRGLWLAISVALGAMLFLLLWAAPKEGQSVGREVPDKGRIARTLRTPGALMLALVFGSYSGQYLALTSFVPLILVEKAGWTLPSASAVGAVVMLANAFGNVVSGVLLDRQFQRCTLIMIAAGAMALGSVLTMSDVLPVGIRIAGAIGFASFGGMIPGALFAGVPRHAPTPAHVSTVNGLMLQGVAIGQFIGPTLAVLLVGWGNGAWSWSLLYLLPMAGATAAAGLVLGHIERKPD